MDNPLLRKVHGDLVWLEHFDPKAFATTLNPEVLVPRPGNGFCSDD